MLFDEPLTPLMGAGLALIIVGVLLVELGVHAGCGADPLAQPELVVLTC